MTEVMFGDHSILTMENGNYKYDIKTGMSGTSVVVQWLRFLISTAGGEGSKFYKQEKPILERRD